MNQDFIENGYILLARKLIDSEIWNKPSDYLKIWVYILMKVNHKNTYAFKKGENYFNWSNDIRELKGVKRHTVDNCIRWLKFTKQITTQKTTRGMHLKVNNYGSYQDSNNYQLPNRLRHTQQLATEQLQNTMDTINKNENNGKKEKNITPDDQIINNILDSYKKTQTNNYRENFRTRVNIAKIQSEENYSLAIWEDIFKKAAYGWTIKGETILPSIDKILENHNLIINDQYNLNKPMEQRPYNAFN